MKDVHPVEQELRSFARRSIFTVEAVAAHGRIRRENTAVLRCGKLTGGFHPGQFTSLLGRTVTRAIPAETAFVESDLGPLDLVCASVSLRRLSGDDTESILGWRGRPDVADQLFSERPPTRREHEDWLAALALRSDRMEFVIVDRQLGPVGTVGLSGIDFGKDEAEYGIMLGEPAARGLGVATLASIAILDHAFDSLGLSRVILRVFSDNERARRLYDRLGFTPAATQPSSRSKGGVMRPVTEMVLTAEGWRLARDRNRPRFEKGKRNERTNTNPLLHPVRDAGDQAGPSHRRERGLQRVPLSPRSERCGLEGTREGPARDPQAIPVRVWLQLRLHHPR